MIDVIIATYNRSDVVNALVDDIQAKQVPVINNIIVVDSSDQKNSILKNKQKVKYIQSNHKNQPYQRYIGYCVAESDILLFLDDDMEILDTKVFDQIESVFSDSNVSGINIAFKNHNLFLLKQQKHSCNKSNRFQNYIKTLQTLSGRPEIDDGKMWYCGLRGRRIDDQYSEFCSGGAFAARRKLLYENFNFNIFSLYEERLGKGEDAMLSYALSKLGKIYNLPGEYFYHNDTGDSVYSASGKAYYRRVAYSRQFLSNEYSRLNDKPYFIGYFITLWYNIWRSLGLLYICFKKISFAPYIGYVSGMFGSILLCLKKDKTEYWSTEIQSNLL